MANVKALVLVEGLADKLKEVEAETLRKNAPTRSNTLVEVKTELRVDALDESVTKPPTLLPDTLAETKHCLN